MGRGRSTDNGSNWTYNRPVAVEPGQGRGNLATNGSWIMAVWPDIRSGPHIRYSLWRDETLPEQTSNASAQSGS
jgi:hypothetical protein